MAIGLAFALTGLGVISTSVFIGLRAGRTESAIRSLLLQCGILAGIPAGAVCAWILTHFSEWIGNGWIVPAYGALGGALAGLCIALLMDAISRRMHAWASKKLADSTLLASARATFH